jgi:hypothetical protein
MVKSTGDNFPDGGGRMPGRAKETIRGRLRRMALVADLQSASQIIWLKTGVLGNSRQHPGANLFAIMECEDIVRIVCMFKSLVRA